MRKYCQSTLFPAYVGLLLIVMYSYLFPDSYSLHLGCVTDLSDKWQQVELLEEQLLRKAMFAIAVANQVDNNFTLCCPVVKQKLLSGTLS